MILLRKLKHDIMNYSFKFQRSTMITTVMKRRAMGIRTKIAEEATGAITPTSNHNNSVRIETSLDL